MRYLRGLRWHQKNGKHLDLIKMGTAAAAAAKLLQSCPTLCDPIDGSPPDSPVPGILQARTLEWVAIFLSNAWKWKMKMKSLSHVRLLATPWTAAHQAPSSMGFPRQEHWSGVPLKIETLIIYLLFSQTFQHDTPNTFFMHKFMSACKNLCNVYMPQNTINRSSPGPWNLNLPRCHTGSCQHIQKAVLIIFADRKSVV